MKDLGNSKDWDFEPDEIEKCKSESHPRIDRPTSNKHSMYKVICLRCGYTYKYSCHAD